MRATDTTYSLPLLWMRGKEIGRQVCHRHSVTQSEQCFKQIAREGIATAEAVGVLLTVGILLALIVVTLLWTLHAILQTQY